MRQSALILTSAALIFTCNDAAAQSTTKTSSGSTDKRIMVPDTVRRPASLAYEQGPIHRYFLGDNYRDLWSTPISVPVLDLKTYAGGLKALRLGGGNQTRSLRLVNPAGLEYVFRPVYKEKLVLEPPFQNTIVVPVFADGLSGSHPTAPLIAHPVLAAVGVPHASPELVVMPDDPALGEFREEVANELGTIEEFPNKPDEGRGHLGLTDVNDSDEMLEMLNEDPRQRIDSRLYLRARLVDFMLNDNDRHRGQWRWVRVGTDSGGRWLAWPRDRDKVFVSHEGALLRIARMARPNFVPFEATYPHLVGLAGKVRFMDGRLLADLDREDWRTIATEVTAAVTDAVITQAVRATPREYNESWPELESKLRSRRDLLRDAALDYYGTLAEMVEVHATDTADVANISRGGDGSVTVTLASGGERYFERRFVPGETREVRVYLHAADDSALVTGGESTDSGIKLRVVGGNGTNHIVDQTASARVYDSGETLGIRYEPDTAFNRRPWFKAYGKDVFPENDYGRTTRPVIGLKSGRGLGVVPEIGFERITYGFRTWPWRSRIRVEGAWSTAINGFSLSLSTDNRFEESRWLVSSFSEFTQLNVGRFAGFGNDLPERTEPFFDVRQRQITFRPAAGVGLGTRTDLLLGPVIRHSSTDSTDNFVSEQQPYGFEPLGQAGVQLLLDHDLRDSRAYPTAGTMLRVDATWFPRALDVESAYGRVAAYGATYHQFNFGTKPVIAARAGGERVSGEFPYFDAAFLGGSRSLRTAHRQQYAGDASLFGSIELRVPIAQFGLFAPWNTGAFAFSDVGRIWFRGESPGGWHQGNGIGLWLGIVNAGTSITFAVTDSRDRRLLFGTGMGF
ncbi:MAG: BamA/TamA family outer membrane protein [Gemmatimonadota bacterium]